jgi:hypothetical protein
MNFKNSREILSRIVRIQAVGLLTCASLLAMPNQAFAFADFLNPAKVTGFVKRQVAKQNLSFKLQQNFEPFLINGVKASVGYHYLEEPSYTGSYFTRYDSYTVDGGLEPSAWVNGFDGPFSLGLTAGSDLIFVREFKTQKEAAFASVYGLDRVPVSAERALSKLATGDFVSLQTHLTLNVALDKSVPVTPAISFGAATHALISGNFLVHLYKVDKTHMRVKLIALHNVEAGASAGFKLTNDLTIIAIKVASGRIRAAWNVNLGSVSKDFDITDLYMVDYIMDLSDPKVAAAYNTLLQKKAVFKSRDMFYLESAKKNLSKVMVTDLTEIENLYHEGLSKPENQRVVDRRFKGSTLTRTVRTDYSISMKTLRLGYQTFFARNKISTVDPNENELYYLFDTFSTFGERKIPFHLIDRTESVNSNLLFTATEDFDPVKFVGLYLTRELRTQSLSRSKFEELKKHVRNTLPHSLYSQLPLDSWDLSQHEAVNVYFKHEVFFPLAAVQAIPVMEPATIKSHYQDYLNSLREIESAPMRDNRPGHENDVRAMDYDSMSRNQIYDRDLNMISTQLSTVFDPKAETDARYEAFLKLKNNDLFTETGAGFLISLLPQDRLNEVLGYSLTLTGKDQKEIVFRYGEPTESDLYRAMRYIQDLINSKNVDLRLLQDMKSTSGESPVAHEQLD